MPKAPDTDRTLGMLLAEPFADTLRIDGDDNSGPMIAFDQSRGDDPDHAEMPARDARTNAAGRSCWIYRRQGLRAVGFILAAARG